MARLWQLYGGCLHCDGDTDCDDDDHDEDDNDDDDYGSLRL